MQTARLLTEGAEEREPNAQPNSGSSWKVAIGNIVCGLGEFVGSWWASLRPTTTNGMSNSDRSNSTRHVDHGRPAEDFSFAKTYCQDLEKGGLLRVLSSAEPEQLGFTFEWYRHSC